MGAVGGLLTGALGLAVFQQLVSKERAYKGFGVVAELPGKWAQNLISPEVPLCPNLAHATCAEKGDVSLISLVGESGDPAAASPSPGGASGGTKPNQDVNAKTIPKPSTPKTLQA